MEKERIYLLIPFNLKDELKKEGIKWDVEKKLWYCIEITEKLKDYEIRYIDIEYMEKDFFKEKLKSMKWDKIERCWMVNNKDFEIYNNP